MSNCPRVNVDLVIVAAGEGLVSEEVDILVFNARYILFGFNVLQTVRLVPTDREDIKRDLATDRVTVQGI